MASVVEPKSGSDHVRVTEFLDDLLGDAEHIEVDDLAT